MVRLIRSGRIYPIFFVSSITKRSAMGAIDIEPLLEDVSSDAPCGEDLEYDSAFGEMERATQGKPEQQFGDTIVPGEDPDWRDVKQKALVLLERTRDLRVAAHLTRALLETDGLPGFCGGLGLIRGFVERFWEGLHPQLDPDDDNDPTFRINTIASLTDPNTTLLALRESPLVRSRSVGMYSLQDVDIANGDAPPRSDDEEPPKLVNIEAAFLDCELDELQADADAVSQAIEHASAVEQGVTEQVGAANAVSLEALVELLTRIQKIYADQLARRGVGVEPDDGEAAGDESDAAAGQANQRLTGDVNSREDAIRALDKVCEYYERHEPSSPLPLLLRRAQRLASKSFLEIVRDLTPEGLPQAEAIGGVGEEYEESEE